MLKQLYKISEVLNENHIDYCLIGGLAVSMYHEARSTKDIDLLISIPRETKEDILIALKKEGLQFQYVKSDLLDPVGDIIYVDIDNERVDMLISRYEYEKDFIKNAATILIGEKEIKIIKLDDLIAMKIKSGGIQDMVDAANLIKSTTNLEIEKLAQKCKKIRIDKRLQRLLDMFLTTED